MFDDVYPTAMVAGAESGHLARGVWYLYTLLAAGCPGYLDTDRLLGCWQIHNIIE